MSVQEKHYIVRGYQTDSYSRQVYCHAIYCLGKDKGSTRYCTGLCFTRVRRNPAGFLQGSLAVCPRRSLGSCALCACRQDFSLILLSRVVVVMRCDGVQDRFRWHLKAGDHCMGTWDRSCRACQSRKLSEMVYFLICFVFALLRR